MSLPPPDGSGPEGEAAQDPQGSDDAEEQAGQPEDLKVVVCMRRRPGPPREGQTNSNPRR